MVVCEKCGAQLGPYVPKCSYCNTITAYGAAQQAEQARYQAAQQFQAQQYERQRAAHDVYTAGVEVQRSADQAFNWAVAGLVLCCIPVLPVVGIVLGFRARAVALSRGIVVPSKVWLAIGLGFASLASFGGLLLLSSHLRAQEEEHRHALEKSIGKHAGDATPSVDAACKMTELYLMDNPFDLTRLTDGNVNCDGSKWTANGDTAELSGVRIRLSESASTQEGNACFKHGQKWVVDTVVSTTCAEAAREKAAGSGTPTSTATTPPTVMAPAPGDPLAPQPATPKASPKAPTKSPPRR